MTLVPSASRALLAVMVLLACAGVLLPAATGGSSARAHTGVVGSEPAAGAVLGELPAEVVVTFSQDVRAEFAQSQVSGPAGQPQSVPSTVDGRTLTVPVEGSGEPGKYQVDFRVTSADGHPVDGSVAFTVQAAPGAAPDGTASDGASTAAASDAGPLTPPDGDRPFSLLLVFLAAAAVAVLAVVRLRRGGPGGPALPVRDVPGDAEPRP